MNIVLEHLIGDLQERALPRLARRDVTLPMLPGTVDTLIGMRRSGKSWRIYQAVNELLSAGATRESLL